LGRAAEAEPLLTAVLAREPNHAGAHAVLAELVQRRGDRAEARRQTEWARFAAQLPRGSRLAFTPEHVQRVEACSARFLSVGSFVFVSVPAERADLIETWLASDTPESTELLAAAWWNAPPDDPEALRIARALLRRGATG